MVQGGFQPFRDEALPQAFNGARAGAQGRDDLGVRIRLAAPLIRQKQNARMGQLPGRCFAYGDQLFQRQPFLHCECNPILVHRGTPCLEAQLSPKPQETTFRVTRQSKINGTLACLRVWVKTQSTLVPSAPATLPLVRRPLRVRAPVRPPLPLCRLVAHPWHAIRVTETMRLRSIQGVRGTRPHAEDPHGADAVIAAEQRNLQGDHYAPSI